MPDPWDVTDAQALDMQLSELAAHVPGNHGKSGAYSTCWNCGRVMRLLTSGVCATCSGAVYRGKDVGEPIINALRRARANANGPKKRRRARLQSFDRQAPPEDFCRSLGNTEARFLPKSFIRYCLARQGGKTTNVNDGADPLDTLRVGKIGAECVGCPCGAEVKAGRLTMPRNAEEIREGRTC